MVRGGSSRRYAQAAFEIAMRDGTVDAWRKDLGLACEVAGTPGVAHAIDNPSVPIAQRRKAVEQLLGPRVSKMALNLGLILAARGCFSLLPDISVEFDELVRDSRGVVRATVTSAAPLSEKELAAVKARVEQLAGAGVEMYADTDPSLIGGLRVMIGDLQIDASVSTRLARLRKQLVQGPS
jgi:F-type H+-transporting ATPase subunit delta